MSSTRDSRRFRLVCETAKQYLFSPRSPRYRVNGVLNYIVTRRYFKTAVSFPARNKVIANLILDGRRTVCGVIKNVTKTHRRLVLFMDCVRLVSIRKMSFGRIAVRTITDEITSQIRGRRVAVIINRRPRFLNAFERLVGYTYL